MRSVLLSSRVRLAVLLGVLAALTAFALVPGGGRSSALGVRWCEQPSGPPSRTLLVARLRADARRDLAGIVGGGAGGPTLSGVVGPETAWRDQAPDAGAPFGGGYELRRTIAGGTEVLADVFPFGSAANAAYYVSQAGRPSCRLDARSRVLPRPRDARAVTWRATGGHWETDVFLTRGALAVRVGVISARAAGAAVPVADVARRVCAARIGC